MPAAAAAAEAAALPSSAQAAAAAAAAVEAEMKTSKRSNLRQQQYHQQQNQKPKQKPGRKTVNNSPAKKGEGGKRKQEKTKAEPKSHLFPLPSQAPYTFDCMDDDSSMSFYFSSFGKPRNCCPYHSHSANGSFLTSLLHYVLPTVRSLAESMNRINIANNNRRQHAVVRRCG